MKILQLVPAMEQGGVERGVVEVNRAIIAEGWENVVVSSGGRLNSAIEKDGGRTIIMDVKSKNPLTFFSRALRLRRILEKEKPDVVCVHSRVPAWLFMWANRTLRIKWITFAHGANSVSQYSRVMTYGDITVTPSEFIAQYLINAYGISRSRLRVISRAIDEKKFDPEKIDLGFVAEKREEWSLAGKFVVMAIGRITQLKGFDMLIKAMAKLPPEFKLVIVGEAEASRKGVEDDLKALVEELSISSRVVFAGNQQKVAECLSLADVVVSSNIRKAEAFGRSMAEALAMNKPVVAKAFGGAMDVVRDGIDGVLVHTSSVDADEVAHLFASAIEKVSRMEFGDLRKSAMERFAFGIMLKKSIEAYKEFI